MHFPSFCRKETYSMMVLVCVWGGLYCMKDGFQYY